MPTPPEKPLFFENLVGGLDQNSALTRIARDQAKRLKNFSLEETNLVTVEGFDQFTTTANAGDPLQGGARIYLADQDPFTLVAYDGDVFPVTDAGVIGSAEFTDRNASNRIYFPYDRRVVMVFDGDNRPKISSNGTDWYDAGLSAPTVAPTAAEDAGGSLLVLNTYEFAYTYATTAAFDGNLVHESNGSATVQEALTGANQSIIVTVTGTAVANVNFINVYARNVTIGQTALRFVGTVANPGASTTTYELTTEPSDLEDEIPTTNDVPGSFRYGWYHNGRFWAFDETEGNRLWFSEVFQPQTWPADYFIDFPTTKGDDLTAGVPMGDIQILFGQTGFFIQSGTTVVDIELRPSLVAGTGAFNPTAACKVDNGVFHVGPAGGFLFTGASDQHLTKPLETGWRDLMRNGTAAQFRQIATLYYPRLKQIFMAIPRLYPDGSAGEYVLDTLRTAERDKPAWFETGRNIIGYIHWDGNEPNTGAFDKLLSWPNTARVLNVERNGNDLNGAPMQAIYEGPAFHTQFREAIAVQGYVEYEPTDGDFTFQLAKGGQVINSQTFNMGGGLSLYGTATYGSGSYGGAARARKVIMLPLIAEGGEFSVNLRYNGIGRARFFSYGFSLVPESQLRTM